MKKKQCNHFWVQWNRKIASSEEGNEIISITFVCVNCETFKTITDPSGNTVPVTYEGMGVTITEGTLSVAKHQWKDSQ